MTAIRHLFVYGTLRRGFPTPMAAALSGRCAWRGYGTVRGRLYEVDGYPGLVESVRPGEWVRGEVFDLGGDVAMLSELDAYEECAPGCPAPHEYSRKILPVQLEDGRRLEAWVYVFNRGVSGFGRIASGDYARRGAAAGEAG